MEERSSFWFWVLPPLLVGLVAGGVWWMQQRRTPGVDTSDTPQPKAPSRSAPATTPVPEADPDREEHGDDRGPSALAVPAPDVSEISAAAPRVATPQEAWKRLGSPPSPLSRHPLFPPALASLRSLRRLVRALDAVAHGFSPRAPLAVFAPTEPFRPSSSGTSISTLGPRDDARYETAVDVFCSIDPAAAAAIARLIEPALDICYRDLGYADGRFEEALVAAVEELAAVPEMAEPARLVRDGRIWRYADPKLEALSEVQKQYLRLGPTNVQRVRRQMLRLQEAWDKTKAEP